MAENLTFPGSSQNEMPDLIWWNPEKLSLFSFWKGVNPGVFEHNARSFFQGDEAVTFFTQKSEVMSDSYTIFISYPVDWKKMGRSPTLESEERKSKRNRSARLAKEWILAGCESISKQNPDLNQEWVGSEIDPLNSVRKLWNSKLSFERWTRKSKWERAAKQDWNPNLSQFEYRNMQYQYQNIYISKYKERFPPEAGSLDFK